MDRLVLGKRIAAARERLKPKMSQEELARQLGIEQSAVGHYENGRRSVPFDKLIKIKEILGVSGSYLLDDDPIDDSDECIIKSPKEHTEDLKKTLKVLSSNTGDALSLHMNINSFHEAVTAKEQEVAREQAFKTDLQNEISNRLSGFMNNMKEEIKELLRKEDEASTPPKLKPVTKNREGT
ncbi:MAG: helix-turn-helix transcriptional regulator [Syntrophaceae bacterium]